MLYEVITHIIGAGVKIPGKLGHFGQGPAHGLFRGRGRAGGPYDLACIRKSGRIPGQHRYGGNAHIKGEITCIYFNALGFIFGVV